MHFCLMVLRFHFWFAYCISSSGYYEYCVSFVFFFCFDLHEITILCEFTIFINPKDYFFTEFCILNCNVEDISQIKILLNYCLSVKKRPFTHVFTSQESFHYWISFSEFCLMWSLNTLVVFQTLYMRLCRYLIPIFRRWQITSIKFHIIDIILIIATYKLCKYNNFDSNNIYLFSI